VPLIEFYFVTS